MQIELAVGVVSRMRVAVRFEIGRPSCVRSRALSSVRWPGQAGLAGLARAYVLHWRLRGKEGKCPPAPSSVGRPPSNCPWLP